MTNVMTLRAATKRAVQPRKQSPGAALPYARDARALQPTLAVPPGDAKVTTKAAMTKTMSVIGRGH